MAQVAPMIPLLRLDTSPQNSSFLLSWGDQASDQGRTGTNFIAESTPYDSAIPYWTPMAMPMIPTVVNGTNAPAAFFRLRLSGYWRSHMDTDHDGMNDFLEEQNPQFLSPTNPEDAGEDWDRDGVSNVDEFRAGTDPDDFSGQLAAADGTFWAIKRDGGLFGWGQNPNGRLGDGTSIGRDVPQALMDGQAWRYIAAGTTHNLAIDQVGKLWAWGDNSNGQLGDGTQIARTNPVRIGTGAWLAVAVGRTFNGGFSVGIQRDGSLWQWGASLTSLSEIGSTHVIPLPERVGTNSDWRAVSVGAEQVVGLRGDETLWQWGLNYFQAFGAAVSFDAVYSTPQQVGGDNHWRHFQAGRSFNLGIQQDGSLWGWGQLPNNLAGNGPSLPVELGYGWRWRAAMAIDNAMVAIRDDGTLWTWGIVPRASGEMEPTDQPQAVLVGSRWQTLCPEMEANSSAAQILARNQDGSLWRISARNDAAAVFDHPTRIGKDYDWQSVSAGDGWSMGLRKDHSLWTWGSAPYFPTNLSVTSLATIRPIAPGIRWQDASAGETRGLAVHDDGSLWLWGETFRYFGGGLVGGTTIGGGNEHGNGGTPTWVPAQSPTPIWEPTVFDRLQVWKTVRQGTDHGVGIQSDGSLWHWGLFPRLANETVASRASGNIPVWIGVDRTWTKVAAGANHCLALDRLGGLWAWGYNEDGQLGTGTTNSESLPKHLMPGSVWTDLAAGDHHSLAIAADGSLWTWGANDRQQAGGTSTNAALVPIQASTTRAWSFVFAGGNSSFAVDKDGFLWAWGANDQGQLGVGDRAPHTAPTLVATPRGWSNLSVSRIHVLGVREDGSLWGWGSNQSGELAEQQVSLSTMRVDGATDW